MMADGIYLVKRVDGAHLLRFVQGAVHGVRMDEHGAVCGPPLSKLDNLEGWTWLAPLPDPPLTHEPTGIGAVVVDADGSRLVRVGLGGSAAWADEDGSLWSWDELTAPRPPTDVERFKWGMA